MKKYINKIIRFPVKKIITLIVFFYKIEAISMMEREIKNYYSKNRVLSAKTKKLTFHNTITGNYYLPSDAHEDIIALAIINNQVFDKEIVDIAKKYIRSNSIVLDIGSNFGQMSILFSNLVGENGKVYAFDADDWIYEILKMNINANNKEKNIITHFGAVSNVDQNEVFFPEQDFIESGTYGSYGIDLQATSGRKIETFTIDSLAINEPISFIKIDIQGFDLYAMQGAKQTIEKNKCPIVFEYEYQIEEKNNMSFQDYVDFVKSINYHFCKVINGNNYLILPN